MPVSIHVLRCQSVLLPLVLGAALPAYAGLGNDLDTSVAEGQPLSAVTRRPDGLLSQQIQTPQGPRVTEYANAQGQVFALTWHGNAPPDLRQLLGVSRFAVLQSAKTQGGLHAAAQSGQDIEVRVFAAIHQFSGAAWVPSLLPAGFDPQTLAP